MKVYSCYLYLICAFLMIGQSTAFSQSLPKGKTDVVVLSQQANGFFQSTTLAIPLEQATPFLAYNLSWKTNSETQHTPLQIRFSEDGQKWREWLSVHEGAHTNKELDWTIGELMYADKKNRFFQTQLKQTSPLNKLQVRWYSPGETIKNEGQHQEESTSAVVSSTCPCPLPDIQSRTEWCPTGDCPPNPNPTATSVTHLIVHHSAGTNIADDWAAVVRSIWDYHVNTNGWSDVGYNFLVDPNGVVYEGRGDNILGAHFCGANTKTMGTCVMGDFTNITPTEDAKMGLTRLLAWKACDRNMNPLDSLFHGSSGLLLPRIAGHRDGCATACPGDSFYPQLPEIRQGIADFIENDCEFLDTQIDALFNASTVHIFPNPTSDVIDIQLENDWMGKIQIELSDVQGKVSEQQIVEKNTMLTKTRFDLKDYQPGLYFIKMKTTEGQKSWKIIVK